MTIREEVPAELAARIDALQSAVTTLEKQIARAGREQLKANALAETQAERLAEALQALQAAEQRRESELSALRAQNQAAVAEARLAVVRAMLPTLDGLDEAIRSGQIALDQASRREPADTVLRRLLLGDAAARRASADATLAAWLDGLIMVRRRLLDALAAEGITPIEAAGRPFDPRRQIAVEVLPSAQPEGTVLHEIRRGFLAGERVLRHAEVAVAGSRKD